LLCPEARRRRAPGAREVIAANPRNVVEYGGPRTAYDFPLVDANPDPVLGSSLLSSYGLNNWVYNPPANVSAIQGRPASYHWRTLNVPEPVDTPLFLDAMWRGGGPSHTDTPATFNGEWTGAGGGGSEMRHFAFQRHGKRVNSAMFDSSVRPITVRGLWKLPWHRHFNRSARDNYNFPAWTR
jgi:prepilin-type processing-associated H-X9-DG protein